MYILIQSIAWLYYLLLFAVPLVLYPHNSEIFEFNKIILTYFVTVLIMFLWIVRMGYEKKIVFRKTVMDIPILVFLGFLLLSTLFSIDLHTSFYGYYTRFHGGILSYITYSILYWGFVSNLNKNHVIKALQILIISSLVVSIYAILQHFGIDKDLWVQEVQIRVFSTLGQPNWLVAWIVSITPLSWIYIHKKSNKRKFANNKIMYGNYWLSVLMFIIYYLVISYTRSRSGLLAFVIIAVMYSLVVSYKHFNKKNLSVLFRKASLPIIFVLIYSIYSGTALTPSITEIVNNQSKKPFVGETNEQMENYDVPTVNFSSTDIRYIVWKGAINVWKDNLILGTGPETFAYSYYQHRPAEHNLVSEWDFLYNKAHNEYINQLSTTGLLGAFGYLIFHLGVIYILAKNFRNDSKETKYIHLALLVGFISIIVTNFAGFSVVVIGLMMFLFPAFSITIMTKESDKKDLSQLSFDTTQKIYLLFLSAITFILLMRIINYWRADLYFAKAQMHNNVQNFQESSKLIQKAIELRPIESIYWQELAEAKAGLALLFIEIDPELATQTAQTAQQHTEKAEKMNPYDVNTIRKQGGVYLKLSYVDPNYLSLAKESINRAVVLAPTEAKLIYNLGAIHLRLGNYEEGVNILKRAIELRPIYSDARYALALAYIDMDMSHEAREQLDYILTNINPNDKRAQEEINNLASPQSETTTSDSPTQ